MSDQTPGSNSGDNRADGHQENVPMPPDVSGPTAVPPIETPRSYNMAPMSPPPTMASNYPRTGASMFGYVRPPGIYWDSITIAWSMITSQLGVYVATSVMTLGLQILIVLGTFAATPSAFTAFSGARPAIPGITPFTALVQLVNPLVTTFCGLCMISVGVQQAQGSVPSISDYFRPFKALPTSLIATAVIAGPLMVANLGMIAVRLAVGSNFMAVGLTNLLGGLLTIPIYIGWVAPALLAGTSSISTGRPPLESVQTVYKKLGWQSIIFGLLLTVAYLVSGLGILLFCIGLLFTLPVATNVIAVHYVYNFPEDQPATRVV